MNYTFILFTFILLFSKRKMHNIYNYSNKTYNFTEIIEKYYNKIYPSFLELEQIHTLLATEDIKECDKEYYKTPVHQFGVSDRKSIFIKDFHHFVDTDETFQVLYEKFIVDVIKPIFNLLPENKLIVQKTPNIRFHLPNCSNIGYINNSRNIYYDIFGIHKDGDFGHPKNETNIIVPLTNMFDTNSVYYNSIPDNGTNNIYEYTNLVMDLNNFYIGNLNECYHYNKINTTGITRVSLDFRVLLVHDYDNYIKINKISCSETFKSKFIVGDYYKVI